MSFQLLPSTRYSPFRVAEYPTGRTSARLEKLIHYFEIGGVQVGEVPHTPLFQINVRLPDYLCSSSSSVPTTPSTRAKPATYSLWPHYAFYNLFGFRPLYCYCDPSNRPRRIKCWAVGNHLLDRVFFSRYAKDTRIHLYFRNFNYVRLKLAVAVGFGSRDTWVFCHIMWLGRFWDAYCGT